MGTSDRFAGPLAATWSAPGSLVAADRLAGMLIDPGAALPVPPATDRDVWALGHGSADQPTIVHLKQAAENEIGTPWPQPSARAYVRYFRGGNRTEYESAVFARQHRLTRAVVTAAVTLDDAWLDEVADGITLLCEQSTWCWPAHDDTFARFGAVVPTVTSPYLDLGAGEVVGQLAWADHVLGAAFDERIPGLRARIRHEARTRVLSPFTQRRDWHWLGLDGHVHNWNPWIHGNVLVAALRLVDDESGADGGERAALVARVIEGIDRYVASLPSDGAIDEGYSYWWNGACRALEALDILAHATGGELDASGVEALRNTVGFPHAMHIGGPWYLNFADGSAHPSNDLPWDALHRAARRFGDETAVAQAASHRRFDEPVAAEDVGLGRLLRALTDEEWRDAKPAEPPLLRQNWLPSIQVMAARAVEGTDRGLYLAVKGGNNGENHNHNDVGTVVVALNSVPVVVDAGRPTYTAQTFGPDRYDIWTMQSCWHSTPQVMGAAQVVGREFAARDVVVEADDAEIRLDLAGAYPRTDIRHWWRVARLDRAAGAVVVSDSWEIDPDDDIVGAESADGGAPHNVVHYLLAGDVHVTGEGTAIIAALDGAGDMVMSWKPATAQAHLTTRDLDDPMLTRVWGAHLTRLSLDLGDAPVGTLIVSFREAR